MTKTAGSFFLLVSCAAAQMVEGNIVDSVTSVGIARVAVHLESASGPDSQDDPYDTVTDVSGHFVFGRVKAGTYVFSYYSPAWLAPEARSFRQIRVIAGGDAVKLEGRMTAMPTISGRVVDGNGNGVANALVGIVGSSVKANATTGALGKFEPHLRPGRYTLSVTPATGMKPPEPEPGSDQVRVWTQVYYTGVTSWEAASKIMLHPADLISGIELKLVPVPAHVVRGMLINQDGTPAPDATVTLNIDEARLNDQEKRPTFEVRTNSAGAFEFPPVGDGDWSITAELERGGVKRRALEWIEMRGHDVENVKLRLAAPFSVHGRVVMEAGRDGIEGEVSAPEPPRLIPHAGRTGVEFGAASWMLQRETVARPGFRTILFDGDGAISPDSNPDGSFGFKSVYEGRYRIAPLAAPAGYYLDSVRLGETEIAAAEVQLSPGTLPITVVYKTGGEAVRGTVKKCVSGAVLLIPATRAADGSVFSIPCGATQPTDTKSARCGPESIMSLLSQGVMRRHQWMRALCDKLRPLPSKRQKP